MFRLTQAMRQTKIIAPSASPRAVRPVVVWNLVRRCNLYCRHCYAASTDRDFSGELSTAEALQVLSDLKDFGIPALILSGGEPLLRPDLFDLAQYAKSLGLYLGLSTNGTLIDAGMAMRIQKIGFDYVGISIDGLGANHDYVRGRPGAFDEAMSGLRHLQEIGVKVGLRFTLTQDNAQDFPNILQLMQEEQVERLYLSHLNYAGRGQANQSDDPAHQVTRQTMAQLFALALEDLQQGRTREFVTGNNDADGVFFLLWTQLHRPDMTPVVNDWLHRWGGNASGIGIANIDNRGFVHPDIFWWHHSLGNVRDHPFSQIWSHTEDTILTGLRQRPRPLKGRCGRCCYQAICNGNTRVRAYQASGDPWAEDPACYLTDAEIGLGPL